jgi:hypothetical protein
MYLRVRVVKLKFNLSFAILDMYKELGMSFDVAAN